MGLFNFGKKAPQPVSRLDELKEIVTRDPSSRQFLALSEEYRKAGKIREQIDALERGLRTNPTYVAAHVSLGRAYEQLGKNNEDAIRAYQGALKQDPQNLVAIRQIADCYLRKGDKVEAIKKLKLYRGLKPGEKEVDELILQLDAELNPKPKEKPAPPPVIPPSSVKPGLMRRTSTYGVSGGGTSPGFIPPAGARVSETTGPIATGAIGPAGLSTGEIRRVGAALATGPVVSAPSSGGFLPPPPPLSTPPGPAFPPGPSQSVLPPGLSTSPIPTSPITSPVQAGSSAFSRMPPPAPIPDAPPRLAPPPSVQMPFQSPPPSTEAAGEAMELTFDGFRKSLPAVVVPPSEPPIVQPPSSPPRPLSAPGFALPESRLGFSVTGSISLPPTPLAQPIQVPIIQVPPISAARPEPVQPPVSVSPAAGLPSPQPVPEPPRPAAPAPAVDLAGVAPASPEPGLEESGGWDVFSSPAEASAEPVPAPEPAGSAFEGAFTPGGLGEGPSGAAPFRPAAEAEGVIGPAAAPTAEAAAAESVGVAETIGAELSKPATPQPETGPPAIEAETPLPGVGSPLVEGLWPSEDALAGGLPAERPTVAPAAPEAHPQPPLEAALEPSLEAPSESGTEPAERVEEIAAEVGPESSAARADEAEPLVSETLAELYRRQGYLEDARSTYERLARQEGDEARASELLQKAQHLGAPEPRETDDQLATPSAEAKRHPDFPPASDEEPLPTESGSLPVEVLEVTPREAAEVEVEPYVAGEYDRGLPAVGGAPLAETYPESIPYETPGPRDEVLRLREYLQRISVSASRASRPPEASADSILESLVSASGVRFAAITDLGGVPVFSAGDPAGAPQEVLEELVSFRETVSRSGELLGAGDFVSVGLVGDGGLAILTAVAPEWVLLVGAGTESPAGRIRYEVGRAAARLRPLLSGDSLPVF